MSTWLLEGGLSVGLFLLLAPLLVAPFFGTIYRRYRYAPPGPTLLAAATGLYACALVAFTTFPLPNDPQALCDGRQQADYWQLRPFASLDDVAAVLADDGLRATLTSGVFLQVAFNVVFFVPLGFLVAYRMRRGVLVALLGGLGVSLLIEATQGTGLWGLYPCPYRLADVDDLMMNTLGAVVGWVLGWAVSRLAPFRDPPRREDLGTPTVRRRLLAAGLDVVVASVATVLLDVVLVFAVEARGGDGAEVASWSTVIGLLVGTALLLVVGLVRRDRATPGQTTVLLGLGRAGTAVPVEVRGGAAADPGAAAVPAARWSVLVRFVVRWVPILVFGLSAVLVVLVVDGITVAVRKDRRSLTGVLARSVTLTHDRLAAPAATE